MGFEVYVDSQTVAPGPLRFHGPILGVFVSETSTSMSTIYVEFSTHDADSNTPSWYVTCTIRCSG